MKQVFERSVGFVILISIIFLSGSAFADGLFGNSSFEDASSIIKEHLIKLFSTVLPYIVFIVLLRTTIGFIWFIAIIIFNFYDKIGFFWSFLASVVLYVIILGLIELIFGKSKIKENKKEIRGGPVGGSHVAEGMIFDKHYDNVIAVWAARKVRDKFFRF